jgi:hypothetical protein
MGRLNPPTREGQGTAVTAAPNASAPIAVATRRHRRAFLLNLICFAACIERLFFYLSSASTRCTARATRWRSWTCRMSRSCPTSLSAASRPIRSASPARSPSTTTSEAIWVTSGTTVRSAKDSSAERTAVSPGIIRFHDAGGGRDSTRSPAMVLFVRHRAFSRRGNHSRVGDMLLRARPTSPVKLGPVEQLECSPPCQGGGRGFKSRQDRSGWSLRAASRQGQVAQSVRASA